MPWVRLLEVERMNSRDIFVRHMHFQMAERLPFMEWHHWWRSTILRWGREGMQLNSEQGTGASSMLGAASTTTTAENAWYADGYSYFGFDVREMLIIDYSPLPRFVPRILEDTEDYRLLINDIGITQKAIKVGVSMPQFMDFPVKSRRDWKYMKKRFDPHDPRRYPKNWGPELVDYYDTVERPVRMDITGFFGEIRWLMGLERFLTTLYDDPGWIHEIMEFWEHFVIETCREAIEKIKIDYVVLWEDMCYNKGMLLSPRHFREFIMPHYRRLTDLLRKNGKDIIMVDSDGNVDELVPVLLEAGVNGIYPLEATCNDVVELRKKYGRQLVMAGNIDKRVLSRDKKTIKKEVDRKTSVFKEGGYIMSVDHSTPFDVPFENYKYYVSLLKECCGL